MINVLITGNCGVGKTYLMNKIIEKYELNETGAFGIFKYIGNDSRENQVAGNIRLAGVYDGTMFEGTDRLAMDVMRVMETYLLGQGCRKLINIFEGDRFTNKKFIALANPFIIKIKGDGSEGRLKRGSNQTERHLKSIATRVANIEEDFAFNNSEEAVDFFLGELATYGNFYRACEIKRLKYTPV